LEQATQPQVRQIHKVIQSSPTAMHSRHPVELGRTGRTSARCRQGRGCARSAGMGIGANDSHLFCRMPVLLSRRSS
jgi:hypothetical protein